MAHWLYGRRSVETVTRRARPLRCPVCSAQWHSFRRDSYAYLLGQYLGDGHLVTKARVPVLRIYCTAIHQRIIAACRAAMIDTLAASTSLVQGPGCVTVQSYSMHWPCLFLQHGPGAKHQRPIVPAPWQREIVQQHPRELLRGLIHADGCRLVNQVTAKGRGHAYPRSLFANESRDILATCGEALDLVGAQWRYNRANSISVARRDSVALLDTFVGPKS